MLYGGHFEKLAQWLMQVQSQMPQYLKMFTIY